MTDNQQEKTTEYLARKLGHRFHDPALLTQALTHPSYAFEQNMPGDDYERLEFLGDAVLDLIIGDLLFRRFPAWPEGTLTAARAALVNQASLAAIAAALGLGDHILLGRGESSSGGHKKPSILSCAFEAVIGALYLDAGYETAVDVVNPLFVPLVTDPLFLSRQTSPKSRLQEILQAQFQEQPTYRIDKCEGPDHERSFTAAVLFKEEILAQGTAGSKKEAEQQAAAAALERITNDMPT